MADFTWSFSALSDFEGCPKRYYETKVLKNYKFQDTPQTIYGKEVHTALEEYVRDGKELAKNYLRFKKMVDSLINIPGDKYCEYEMGLTKDKKACAFDDPNRWVRGIADLVVVDGDRAYVIDYKTGSKKYPKPKQLKLMALMIFEHFPEVNTIKGGLLFVMHDTFITDEYKRENIEKYWGAFEQPLLRLDTSYKLNKWTPNPTPLCGWCPVDTCEYHNPRK